MEYQNLFIKSILNDWRITAFILSALVGYKISSLVIKHIAPIGFYDLPAQDRTNKTDYVPRTAGITFMVSLFFAHQFKLIDLPYFDTLTWGLIAFIALLGLADDFRRLNPITFITAGFKTKYTLIIALVFGLALGSDSGSTPLGFIQSIFSKVLYINSISPLGYPSETLNFAFFGMTISPSYPLIVLGVTLLCWGMPNLFNLIDGLDGLAMGYFGLAAFMIFRFDDGTTMLSPIFWGLWASVFYLNIKKVHFLGDAGSLSMGLVLAIGALHSIKTDHIEHILFLFAYPILDTIHVSLIRLKQGRSLGQGDHCHLHHFIWNQTGENLKWTLGILWTLAFLPMLRLWEENVYQYTSLVGLGLLIMVLGFSFSVQLNRKANPSIKS